MHATKTSHSVSRADQDLQEGDMSLVPFINHLMQLKASWKMSRTSWTMDSETRCLVFIFVLFDSHWFCDQVTTCPGWIPPLFKKNLSCNFIHVLKPLKWKECGYFFLWWLFLAPLIYFFYKHFTFSLLMMPWSGQDFRTQRRSVVLLVFMDLWGSNESKKWATSKDSPWKDEQDVKTQYWPYSLLWIHQGSLCVLPSMVWLLVVLDHRSHGVQDVPVVFLSLPSLVFSFIYCPHSSFSSLNTHKTLVKAEVVTNSILEIKHKREKLVFGFTAVSSHEFKLTLGKPNGEKLHIYFCSCWSIYTFISVQLINMFFFFFFLQRLRSFYFFILSEFFQTFSEPHSNFTTLLFI